ARYLPWKLELEPCDFPLSCVAIRYFTAIELVLGRYLAVIVMVSLLSFHLNLEVPYAMANKTAVAQSDVETSNFRLPRTVIPRQYNIKLSPDLMHFKFAGEEIVHVDVQE